MKQFLKEQYGKLLSLKAAPTDPAAVKGLMEQFERLVGYVGESRFAAAISKCVAELNFFPSVSDIESRIPPAEQSFSRCRDCQNTSGFIVETRPHPILHDRTHQVARKCRHGAA